MKSDDIIQALDIGHKWTRQIKAEEKRPSARQYRGSMYTVLRRSLKSICYGHMTEAWNKASDNGRLPTHWRQVFYVMRPIANEHPDSDRPLYDDRFKGILESYLADYEPGWDVLRGARGVFKEPHAARDDSGLPMSTMNVRNYLCAPTPSPKVERIPSRFPTSGAKDRMAAILICEKEGFDDLLQAEQIPARYDLALMSTKGISAKAARDLAEGVGVPCFTLHDLDKNGFVMASAFPFATDIGIRIQDVEEWNLDPEEQYHRNEYATRRNLRRNGATEEEADFIAGGQRVELNMFTSDQLVEFVEGKLEEHGVKKIVPDKSTLEAAWDRAHVARRINSLIDAAYDGGAPAPDLLRTEVPPMPDDLADRIRSGFADDDSQSWDEVLWDLAEGDAEAA
jgi:hypothetical protein